MFSLLSAILSRGQSSSCGYLAVACFLDLKDFPEINLLQTLEICMHSLAVVPRPSSGCLPGSISSSKVGDLKVMTSKSVVLQVPIT